MEDAGDGWATSQIFDDDFFGPVRTRADDDWVVTSGPFAFLPSVWDREGRYSSGSYENAYGVVTYPGNPLHSPYLQRSSRFCGRETQQEMPGCHAALQARLARSHSF